MTCASETKGAPKPYERENTPIRYQDNTRLRDLKASVLATAGFSATEAAWILDISRASVYRSARRMGFKWQVPDEDDALRNPVRRDLDATEEAMIEAGNARALLAPIARMKPSEAVDHLIWLVGELLWSEEIHNPSPAPGLRLTMLEARFLFLLDRRRGHVVPKRSVYEAIYAEVAEDERPTMKNLDVVLVNLRRKLVAAGVATRIETVHDRGWCLQVVAGALDWQRPLETSRQRAASASAQSAPPQRKPPASPTSHAPEA